MTTITINKDNFGEKMSYIYQKLLDSWQLQIDLKEDNKLIWTEVEQKIYNEAMIDYEKGDIIDWKEVFKKLLSE